MNAQLQRLDFSAIYDGLQRIADGYFDLSGVKDSATLTLSNYLRY